MLRALVDTIFTLRRSLLSNRMTLVLGTLWMSWSAVPALAQDAAPPSRPEAARGDGAPSGPERPMRKQGSAGGETERAPDAAGPDGNKGGSGPGNDPGPGNMEVGPGGQGPEGNRGAPREGGDQGMGPPPASETEAPSGSPTMVAWAALVTALVFFSGIALAIRRWVLQEVEPVLQRLDASLHPLEEWQPPVELIPFCPGSRGAASLPAVVLGSPWIQRGELHGLVTDDEEVVYTIVADLLADPDCIVILVTPNPEPDACATQLAARDPRSLQEARGRLFFCTEPHPSPGQLVRQATSLGGWCAVVIADKKTRTLAAPVVRDLLSRTSSVLLYVWSLGIHRSELQRIEQAAIVRHYRDGEIDEPDAPHGSPPDITPEESPATT
ncbi:MAG: hypothetical protein QGG40_17005 [Myxococcota bacterium]|nr:hypothetical protein [Myxococcota bacterium]